ncbi:MAG: hypothetical protein B6A08_13610 [Sorangiineae bacterium NIC37A_2]|jgi:hypothetical protein|nr:MAG: hypothetical protein B6A08_13610 [Sorangiineae bacterium NIC37A_2]
MIMMDKQKWTLGIGWCFLALFACSREGGSGSPLGKLCPSCKGQVVGGESSDFGGGQENCLEEEQALTEEIAEEFEVDELMAMVSGQLETAFGWSDDSYSSRADTTLSATFTLGTPSLVTVGNEDCRDHVRVPVTIQATTADGGFEATFEGKLEVGRGGETPTLYAQADLASVVGNLPLDVDTSRRHKGYLQWGELGLPEARSGGVGALIAYLPPEYEGLGGAAGPGDAIPVGVPGVEYVDFFIGRFPADD